MSRFEGKLDLQLAEDSYGRPVTRGGRSLWSVMRGLAYTTKAGDRIEIPPGFYTDLASIPRPFWNLLPPDGPWTLAAVVHDFLYATHGTGVVSDGTCGITRKEPFGALKWPYSRAESDGILLEAMEDLGVPRPQRLVIYLGVRVGGWLGWGS